MSSSMIVWWSLLRHGTRQSPWLKTNGGRKFGTFNEMIIEGKCRARRSLVLEDGTTNLRQLWFKDDRTLNDELFDSKAQSILRWRLNSNGTINGGSYSKRFLLIQFCDQQHYADACRYLQSRYDTTVRNNICTVRNGRQQIWPKLSAGKLKLFIKPDILSNGLINHYRIMTADSEHLIGYFDDYLIKSSAQKHQRHKPGSSFDSKRIEHLISKIMQGQNLLSDDQYRIRFQICHQLEQSWKSCKNDNQFELIPFGSDVSGFGTDDSDLDLCLVNKMQTQSQQKVRTNRSIRILRSISSTMEMNNKKANKDFPQIQRIFRAFVPIIKCRSRLMPSINIDISVDTESNSGVQMARYLYYCSQSCPSIRGLILLLKSWAKHHGIVHSYPGDWFSSFQLTILAIAFLQSEHLIMTINEWQQKHDDIQAKQQHDNVDRQIRQLLQRFFPIHLAKSSMLSTKMSACYIINPFANNLNITKTVSDSELERFLCFCKQSLQLMQRNDFVECSDLFTDRIDDRLHALTTSRN
ncbi:hypothetical protein DERP_009733 [Dermatophagoides pteronyssinus]|uniref:Poly(A) RNA polymerase mitochondrial-like central palm domain-containing protein n=1 Tax=Dermatophagoides pteronyssinus TaxID=6956 RepID=A0ABQ8IRE1_DERPT|nr:hypothetical protein DERP_009733 [Dermatophagoides pteronyssinus]